MPLGITNAAVHCIALHLIALWPGEMMHCDSVSSVYQASKALNLAHDVTMHRFTWRQQLDQAPSHLETTV